MNISLMFFIFWLFSTSFDFRSALGEKGLLKKQKNILVKVLRMFFFYFFKGDDML